MSQPLAERGEAAAARPKRPAFFWLATATLIVVILARGREVVVPIALAVMIGFVLNPTVRRLELRLGRGVSVALVVLVSLAATMGFGLLLKHQLVDLSAQMTKYSDSIHRKVVALRGTDGPGLESLWKSFDRVAHELDAQAPSDQAARPVRIVPAEGSATDRLWSAWSPLVEPIIRSIVVLVLVIFFLIKREDLRDRFIRLAGRGNLTLTTRALDEAGRRISRFLARMCAINGAFGLVVSVGLAGIGVPYAPLWGFLAAVLRFVPFVGTLLAMLLPAALAFAQFPGWWEVVATLGLFLVADGVTAYVVEPVLIGTTTGVSSMAMLVSALFWSWLWGPVGLVLSTPITVTLAVLGKHVPSLSYLGVLLSDEPALEDNLVLYQRLLAGDEAEAVSLLDRRFREQPRAQVFDEVVVPTLLLASRDRAQGDISDGDHQDLVRTIRALIDVPSALTQHSASHQLDRLAPSVPQRIVGVSTRSASEETIWEMLEQLLGPDAVAIASQGTAYLTSDVAAEATPELTCVTSMPPGGLAQAGYVCRRLRAKLPETFLLVVLPGVQEDQKETADKLVSDGATRVCFSIGEARLVVQQQLIRILAERPTAGVVQAAVGSG